jgi:hypothetical protein
MREYYENITFNFNSLDRHVSFSVNDEDGEVVTLDRVADAFADFMSAAFGYRIEVTLDTGMSVPQSSQ